MYSYFLDTQKNRLSRLSRLTCKNEWSLYDYSRSKNNRLVELALLLLIKARYPYNKN